MWVVVVIFGMDVKVEFNLGDVNVDIMDKVIKVIDEIIYIGGVIVLVFVL